MSVTDRPSLLHDQLDAFGWRATSSVETLRIEGTGAPGSQLGRAWSYGGSYCSIPVPNSMYVLFTIEGTGRVVHDGVEIASEPNQLIFLDGEAESTIELDGATARYLWRFDSSGVLDARSRERLGEALLVHDSLWAPVRALTNGLIDADPAIARSVQAVRASELLLTAIVENTARSASSLRRPEDLYGAALSLIESSSSDPSFTPARLARELQVSERILAEAFSFLGGTPAGELDRRRAVDLGRLLRDAPQPRASFARLVEEAGFASPDEARRALARWAGDLG